MNDVARADADALAPAASATDAPPAGRTAHRGRLFRKYLTLTLSLVTVALLVSGAISVYFTYQETRSSLASLQYEKAVGAASRIEQYMRGIEQQLVYAALPQLDAGDIEQRRIEFLKLLRQAPEVTDVAQVDANGRERIAVSRLGMDTVDSGKDRSTEPAFRNAKRAHTWFGPVYFRKETEPYMTMAVRSGGDKGPVTIADVNLKFIWDVVSRIKVGDRGKAYVVDDRGFLVADPDIGLVLRKTNLADLPHVKAALSGSASGELAVLSSDLSGARVLTAMAPIDSLDWKVFVEQPASEVYAKLNASILRTGLLLLAGFVLSGLAAWALTRNMVRPIRTLEDGARRIGAGDLDQKIDVRTGDELEALAGQFNRMSSQLKESYAGLERKVEARTHELQNALEQQTAISEILRVISSSPTDVQPVLQAVAERAAHLCDAPFARVMVIDGNQLHPAADYSTEPVFSGNPVPLARTSITGRAVVDRTTVHFADVAAVAETEFPGAVDNIRHLGCRAVLAVPLLREGGAYGGIFLFRRDPGLFSPDQVALVQTFARQAAIAIDNVRLFNETKEALDQQTAISEILRVISGSPEDVKPMLNAVAERALRLCDATQSTIVLVDGGNLRFAAGFGSTPTLDEGEAMPLTRGSIAGRSVIERAVIHLEDLAAASENDFPVGRALQRRIGNRAILSVPLMREDHAIGAIALWRTEPRRFSDKQIALVKTFADQAAIAIENVRLFNETKEALDQQTAISEILRVISGSPGDVKPMLSAVAERALKLCDATQSTIVLVDGDNLRFAAGFGTTPTLNDGEAMSLTRGSVTGRAVIDRTVIHLEDLAAASEEAYPIGREMQRRIGHRAILAVPLMREDRAIGAIALWRMEARRFSDKQIALVKTFADQAAIAIENVRLFNETKEALEQQTAVAEILRVISSSPTDVQPVLDAIAERAAKLCDASAASMYLIDGDVLKHLASQGPSPDPVSHVDALPISRDSLTGRAVLEQKTIQLPDLLAAAEEYPLSHEIARRFGHRTVIVTPLVREGRSFGAILLRRQEVRPFSEREAALLRTFGDQAAIALENVRLFNETKEALERQTATAEVLRAISRTTFELQPVLEMLIENATRMCKAENGHVLLRDGDVYRLDASHGAPPEFIEFMRHNPIVPDYGTAVGRAALTRQIVHIEDAKTDPTYRWAEARDKLGFRSILAVPMLRKGEPIGVVAVWRDEVRPFAARDIDLVASFADQAVIAIENVRLFNETKEALEQQRASGEVLAAISSSIADTTPVFDKIIESCQRLFAGRIVGINVVGDDGLNRLVGYHGPGREEIEQTFPAPVDESTGTGVAILRRDIVQLPDIDHGSGVPPVTRRRCQAMGIKAVAIAPMLWEGKGIGAIFVGRDYEGSFSTKDLGLLKTFADQAAIAIQNARLFNETREALDQQRASGEVLAAISNSIADTSPVFERILAGCERLFAGKVAQINLVGDDGMVRLGAYQGPGRERMERLYPFPVDRTSATGMAILDRSGLHFPDVDHDPRVPPRARTGWQAMDIKSIIGAPMMWENRGIGAIFVGRGSAGPFSEKDISLLRTFADQAVIAVQNARLFNETREALEQQRASGEVLAAISSSIADTTPVFEKILASCERLFAGKVAGVNLVGDDGLVRLCAYHGPGREQLERVFPVAVDESGSGAAISSRSVIHYPDVLNDEGVPEKTRRACQAVGYKGVIFAPMVWEGKAIGVIFVGRDHVGPFSEKDIALLKTFADQAVIAIQNARLFREIEEKSRQLEVANKHKSEFLANMSHELRTPLNAIIGFSEVLLERLFGGLNEKQEDYMKDIHSSGKHLLTLINDILDLSKIEAGRMELEPSSFDLATALANALTLVRERAQRHGIALGQDVDPRLGDIVADERKFKQILLNLLSNAVKFTPDGGRIDVIARLEDHDAVIAVHDTGIGIAPEDRDAVFEEFRQVGHDYTKKQEGTGLGLALTRKFVELHGGRIWLESELGKGSTFTFTIPLRL